jgi:glycerol kinase
MPPDPTFLLALDQGTTSSRAILFDRMGQVKASQGIELRQIYPANGWVEHEPEEIWKATLTCARGVLKGINPAHVAGIGITNQRETTVLWDRTTGKALHNAIVWQDRRTAARCKALKAAKLERRITARTGLLLDPYFSATKMEWLLDHVPGSRAGAKSGQLALGTMDSWLIYKLTGGAVHATDVTNASRTMLFNLEKLEWDPWLLDVFNVPRAALADVRDSSGHFGDTKDDLFGARIPILGVAGDQQAASFGQVCFRAGDVKSTYGTGCFVLVNTGKKPVASKNRLLATNLYRIGGKSAYAVEGSIFIAGAVVQWLRDALGLIANAAEIEALARTAKPAEGLYFVPAFTGLGAPYWNPEARGAIVGLTRDMGRAEIARAALDAVCYQTRDLLEAMAADMKQAGLSAPKRIKVDGGMVRNDWFCQRLADLIGLPVDRPKVTETTALGAAYLAGLAAGLFTDANEIEMHWALDRRFVPAMKRAARDVLYDGWKQAVAKIA